MQSESASRLCSATMSAQLSFEFVRINFRLGGSNCVALAELALRSRWQLPECFQHLEGCALGKVLMDHVPLEVLFRLGYQMTLLSKRVCEPRGRTGSALRFPLVPPRGLGKRWRLH